MADSVSQKDTSFPIDYEGIGIRIHNKRKDKSLTQAELAELVGVEATTISHIECASTKLSFPVLVNIANALGVSLDYLVYDSLSETKSVSFERINALIKGCSNKELKFIADILESQILFLHKHFGKLG